MVALSLWSAKIEACLCCFSRRGLLFCSAVNHQHIIAGSNPWQSISRVPSISRNEILINFARIVWRVLCKNAPKHVLILPTRSNNCFKSIFSALQALSCIGKLSNYLRQSIDHSDKHCFGQLWLTTQQDVLKALSVRNITKWCFDQNSSPFAPVVSPE